MEQPERIPTKDEIAILREMEGTLDSIAETGFIREIFPNVAADIKTAITPLYNYLNEQGQIDHPATPSR